MSQLWTIVFLTLLAIAFGIAAWHDREERKRQGRKDSAAEKRAEREVNAK